jgi:RNA polymerase sigma-70 factor (ECF subfamily)
MAAATAADERRLVEAAQKDPARFGDLYELNFERVYAYFACRVRNREEAQDLTSEVFHRALASLSRFEWRGVPFSAWLMKIAANALADRWQRAARERGNPAPEPAAETHPEDFEARATLYQLVRALPRDQRRVIQARFAEQKSIREIAGELKKSEGAVKQLQFRALEKLRAQMSETNG